MLGGSVIALELAQAFLRLGSKVTLLARSTLLSKEDADIGTDLTLLLKKEGMNILTHTTPTQISHETGIFCVKTELTKINGDALLVATGRRPNTEKLCLDSVGVKVDKVGSIIVDEYMQTSVDNIYAGGDCTNQPQYVYVAAAAGTRAAANMMGIKVSLDLSIVPRVVFTDPQVAVVGLTELQAKMLMFKSESRKLTLDNVPRALANFDTRGFIKIVADKESGRILGAHILADSGGELVQTMAIAIKKQMTVKELSSQMFPYLTMVEGLKLCAQIFFKDVKKLSCCADLGVFSEEEEKKSEDSMSLLQTIGTFVHNEKKVCEKKSCCSRSKNVEEDGEFKNGLY